MAVRENETGEEKLTDGTEATGLAELVGEREEQELPANQKVEKETETVEEKTPADAGGDLTDEQVAALPAAEQGFYKAMKSERTNRQTAEKSVETLTAQVTQLMEMMKTSPQQVAAVATDTAAEKKSFWDDPDAFLEEKLAAMSGRFDTLTQSQQNQKLEFSEMLAKSRYPDYEEKRDVFMQAAQANPALAQQFLAASDPAEAAYQYAKQATESAQISEAGGLDAMREKIKAELIAGGEISETATAAEQAIAEVSGLPQPMAAKRSAGPGMAKDTFAGPTALSDMVG